MGGFPNTLVLQRFSTESSMNLGNPVLPIQGLRMPLREGLANRAPFLTPFSTIPPAFLPAPAATFNPGISFRAAELTSMLAVPCTITLARFTLNCAFLGPFSILLAIHSLHLVLSASHKVPPINVLCPRRPTAESMAPAMMDMCRMFSAKKTRSMQWIMLRTASQLSARTSAKTTIPPNTIGVSTQYSIAAELMIMTENMIIAGTRMVNSRDALE